MAIAKLGDAAELANFRPVIHDLHGYLTNDPGASREHRAAAWKAVSESEGGQAPQRAQVLVGIADLALRTGQYEQAVRLLAASATILGQRDHSHPDIARIDAAARAHLDDEQYAKASAEGAEAPLPDLVAATLAT